MSLRRTSLRYARLFLLVTLPITILPVLSGMLGAVIMSYRRGQHIDSTTRSFMDEVDHAGWLSDWEVPGVSIHDFMDTNNPFHLTRVTTRNWLKQLNFHLPEEYRNADVGIDKMVSLDDLTVDLVCHPEYPLERWLYVTGLIIDDIWMNDWDHAFNEIVQRAYFHPHLNATGLHFMECTNSRFACGIWDIKYPALLHFKVDTDDTSQPDSSLTYNANPSHLSPVAVRIIELPYDTNDAWLPISLPTFAGPREQLLALMTTPDLYEQWTTYDIMEMPIRRFSEHMDTIWEWKGTPFPYFRAVESFEQDWITEPLYLEFALEVLQTIVFTISLVVVELAQWPVWRGWMLLKNWIGYPQYQWGRRDPDRPTGFVGNMMAGFGEFLEGRALAASGPTLDAEDVRAALRSPAPT